MEIVIQFLTVIHVLTCILIILMVLVQGGDNVDIAAAFGGASQTAFGPRGSVTVLHKATWILGAVFVFTSLTLGVWASRGSSRPVLGGGPVQSQEVPVE